MRVRPDPLLGRALSIGGGAEDGCGVEAGGVFAFAVIAVAIELGMGSGLPLLA